MAQICVSWLFTNDCVSDSSTVAVFIHVVNNVQFFTALRRLFSYTSLRMMLLNSFTYLMNL